MGGLSEPAALAHRFGSPAYVYELDEVRASWTGLQAALPDATQVFYSLKANPHPGVVSCLHQLGAHAEISSDGELRAALAAGVLPRECLYTGPGKTTQEIAAAIRAGVRRFSVDSPTDIRHIASIANAHEARLELVLRINPSDDARGAGLTMTGAPSQFGVDAEWVRSSPREFVGTSWAPVVGFHVYLGSNVTSDNTLRQMFEIGCRAARELADVLGIEPRFVDLGGGFGQPFGGRGERHDFSSLRQPLTALLDASFASWRQGQPTIAFESGRYLVGSCGTLLTTVQDVKYSRGHPFVVLDSGINHLGGMAGLRRVPRIGAHLSSTRQASPNRAPLHGASVVGPLCTPLDSLAQGVDLPGLARGDVLVIPNVGAYALTGSLIGFLSREAPVEILLDGGAVVDASRLELVRRTMSAAPSADHRDRGPAKYALASA